MESQSEEKVFQSFNWYSYHQLVWGSANLLVGINKLIMNAEQISDVKYAVVKIFFSPYNLD